MKNIIVTACLFGVLAVIAGYSILPEDQIDLTDTLETTSEDLAEEAIALGQILRYVAADMAPDVDEEEYSFRSFWEKFKASMKKAGKKMKVAFKTIGKELKEPVKVVAKAAAKVALEKAQEILKKKAVTLVAKILEKSIPAYAIEDNVNETDFFEQLRIQIDQVGQRLIIEGQALKFL
uniref:Putative conserved secreted protein midgut overexpressed n=1 Tax=Rhipicephalus microplus TaxID=6941 RepID=A0A6M2CFN2_RHIMP